MSYIDTNYRTIGSREGRAVAGVSMGGWGAMLLGLKHHQLFAAAGALSAPYLISRHSPNMDMSSREQQTFGTLHGHSWELWDDQLVNFIEILGSRSIGLASDREAATTPASGHRGVSRRAMVA